MPSPGYGRQRVAAVSGDEEGSMDELEDFLKASEPVEEVETAETPVEPVEAPEEAQAEPEGPARGPDGKFIAKGEKPAEEPQSASPAPEQPTLEHPALLGERRRRQEAEDRLRAMETELQSLKTAPTPQVQAPADFWEDPEGYIQNKASQLAAEQARQIVQGELLSRSMNRVRGKYEDFNEAAQTFGQMIQRNPDLYEQMLAADEPAEFAYTQAKEQMELSQYGSISALVAAKVAAELAKAQPAPTPVPTPIPETLADAQSAASAATAIPAAKSFDDILGRRFA